MRLDVAEVGDTLWSKSWSESLSVVVPNCTIHQQNVNRFGSNTQSSQTLRATSPVLLSTSRCSKTPLELSKVLSDSARAFSGCYEISLIG